MGGAIALISMAISAYGSYQQSRAQAAMDEYNAKVAQQKADTQARALDAERRAKEDELRSEMGTRRTRMAGTGVDIESGSALVSLTEAATQNQYDVLELQRRSENVRKYGETEASLLRISAKNAKRAGNWGVASATARGASNTYSAYQQDQRYKED